MSTGKRVVCVLVGLIMLLIGIAGAVHGGQRLALATGWSGETGTFTTAECHGVGTGRSRREECSGTFAASGDAIEQRATTTDDETHTVGQPFPAHFARGTGVFAAGAGSVLTAVGELLVVLFPLLAGPGLMAAGFRSRGQWYQMGRFGWFVIGFPVIGLILYGLGAAVG